MKVSSIPNIKQELKHLDQGALMDLCLRLAKHKKENKELLHYLLFEAYDQEGFREAVKAELEAEFSAINLSHTYYAKKSVRKILRQLNKYLRFSGDPVTKVELLLWFCQAFWESGIRIRHSRVLMNLYERQVAAIEKALAGLHEDLQFDYQDALEELKARI